MVFQFQRLTKWDCNIVRWSSHKSHSFHVKLFPHFNEIVCMEKISLAIYNVYHTEKQFLLAAIYLRCKYIQYNYSGKWDTWKKCTLWKYLQYTVQCRSVDVTVNYCKSLSVTFIPLYLEQQLNVNSTGSALHWDYSGKWDTWKKCNNYIDYVCSVW